MTAWFGRRTRPVRPWVLAALTALGAVCGAGALDASLAWLPPTWLGTVVALREESSPWILAAAALGAAGAQAVSSRSIMVGPSTARAGWECTVRSVGAMVVALWIGLSLTGGTALALTAVRSEAGRPDLAPILAVAAAAAVWVALGYAVGVLVPRGWNILVAIIAAGIVWLVGGVGGPALQPVALVWGVPWPVLGDRYVTASAWLRLLLLVAVSGTLVMVAARASRRPGGHRVVGYDAMTAACLLPVIALGAASIVRAPATAERADVAPLCAQPSGQAESSVCVHVAHRRMLDPLAQHVGVALELIDQPMPVLVVERAVATQTQMDAPATVSDGTLTVVVDPADRASRGIVMGSILSVVVREQLGYTACVLEGMSGTSTQGAARADGIAGLEVIAAEVVSRAELEYVPASSAGPVGDLLAGSLATLSDSELKTWLDENRDDIARCSVDPRSAA